MKSDTIILKISLFSTEVSNIQSYDWLIRTYTQPDCTAKIKARGADDLNFGLLTQPIRNTDILVFKIGLYIIESVLYIRKGSNCTEQLYEAKLICLQNLSR